MKPEEIMHMIAGMDNGERIRLLELLYDKFYDNRPPAVVLAREKQYVENAYEEGVMEGRMQAKKEVAQKMFQRGYYAVFIQEITELPSSELVQIAEDVGRAASAREAFSQNDNNKIKLLDKPPVNELKIPRAMSTQKILDEFDTLIKKLRDQL